MRLTCPNCSAKYEVDESMIPAVGRDVQCSNCATTWFQPGVRSSDPDPAPETPAETDDAPEVSASDPAEDAPAAVPDPEPTPQPDPDPEPKLEEIDIRGPSATQGANGEDDAPERPPRRQIEAGVADILRQEAEREARLRRGNADPDPVQTQSEMSLSSNEDRSRARRLVGLEDAEDAFEVEDLAASAAVAAAVPPPSRKELLPDIEEINSTLRATGDRSQGEDDASDVDTIVEGARRRSRVRTGFFLVVALAAIAVLLYVYADRIIAAAPAAGPALDGYVGTVDAARFWLDDIARSVAGDAAGPSE